MSGPTGTRSGLDRRRGPRRSWSADDLAVDRLHLVRAEPDAGVDGVDLAAGVLVGGHVGLHLGLGPAPADVSRSSLVVRISFSPSTVDRDRGHVDVADLHVHPGGVLDVGGLPHLVERLQFGGLCRPPWAGARSRRVVRQPRGGIRQQGGRDGGERQAVHERRPQGRRTIPSSCRPPGGDKVRRHVARAQRGIRPFAVCPTFHVVSPGTHAARPP